MDGGLSNAWDSGRFSIVEDSTTWVEALMATVSFSVPDEVKEAFDAAFPGRNKSAVIAQLMTRAVEEQARHERRADLYRKLTARRAKRPTASKAKVAGARTSGR
jgi:hypothetical protein